jgi:hypothetical protein
MSKKKLVLALGCALLLAGSAAVVAGIGGGSGSSDINDNGGFPGGDPCICTQQYAPVVCVEKNPDGTLTKHAFSNSCFAGCAGFTNCVGAATSR